MVTRRSAVAMSLAAVVASTLVLSAQSKPTEAQTRETEAIAAILKIVDGGQAAPNDLSLEWAREDFLKAQGNRQYVPFTVTIDRRAVSGNTVTVHWSVIPKLAPGTDAAKTPELVNVAFEDMNTATLPSAPGPARISRSFTVEPGTYDVLVVVKEPTSTQRNAKPPKVSLLVHTLEVPDFWNDQLNTSSVIIAERFEPLAAPLTPEQQIDRPYALGTMEIVPALDMAFGPQTELGMFLLIYNAQTDTANKPDVSVEYSFYQREGAGETFYNKTAPQDLNAGTLPPEFDMAAGHQLQSGQVIPLASFPAGEYRLEIKVTDKLASTSVTRDVNFTVSGS